MFINDTASRKDGRIYRELCFDKIEEVCFKNRFLHIVLIYFLTNFRELGVFQGVIVSLDCGHITINKCFHNGMRFKRQEAEIKISKDEITDINILQLPSSNTPSPPNPVTNVVSSSTKQFRN